MANWTCVTFDCDDVGLVADFWAAALAWERKGDRVVSPEGGIFLEFIKVPEPKTVKNRLHLGLGTQDLDAEIARLEALGATFAWEEEFPQRWPFRNIVLRDPEGNEFCLGSETH
jgi:predicted enzyme related to lactoylglutathione lyase